MVKAELMPVDDNRCSPNTGEKYQKHEILVNTGPDRRYSHFKVVDFVTVGNTLFAVLVPGNISYYIYVANGIEYRGREFQPVENA